MLSFGLVLIRDTVFRAQSIFYWYVIIGNIYTKILFFELCDMGIEIDLSRLTVSKFAFIQVNIDSSIELIFFF